MALSEPVLELRSILHIYGGGNVVLKDLSLTVAEGERLAITGPSGCGKSTLLNIAGLLERPTGGQVLVDGADVEVLTADEQARVRNEKIGFVFQVHHLLPQCTALENTLVPLIARGPVRAEDEARARALLESAQLGRRMHFLPAELSVGERQRVAVVRALLPRPKLILADEPTGALDRRNADYLVRMILDLNREVNAALVVVTHSAAVAEQLGASRQLEDGALRPA